MKKLLFLIFSASFLAFCVEDTTMLNTNDISSINIHFEDYDPLLHKSFLDIKVENGINPIQQQLKISEDGKAEYNFINNKTRELILNYENREFSLIISKNEKINLRLTVAELTNWQSKFADFEVTSGQNRETNNLILMNATYLDSLNQSASSPFDKSSGLSDIEYKDKRLFEMDNHLSHLNSRCISNNIQNKGFINWAKAQIKYKAGSDLSSYPFMGTFNREINDESDYFVFIDKIQLVSEDHIRYQAYLDYMSGVKTSFEIIANISNMYASERQLLKEKSFSNSSLLFNMIKNRCKTQDAETLFAYVFSTSGKLQNKFLDSLQLYIKDPTLLKHQNKNESKTLVSLLEDYDISHNEKQELLTIYKELEGNVIFHDFWFTNCAPCMKELPNYNDLIASTKTEDVEFIFYGAYMTRNEWQQTIDRFELQGKHHLLSKNQIAFFEKYFDLYGFPHHQLLKDNGQIGDKVNLRVETENFDRIRDIIQNHHGA